MGSYPCNYLQGGESLNGRCDSDGREGPSGLPRGPSPNPPPGAELGLWETAQHQAHRALHQRLSPSGAAPSPLSCQVQLGVQAQPSPFSPAEQCPHSSVLIDHTGTPCRGCAPSSGVGVTGASKNTCPAPPSLRGAVIRGRRKRVQERKRGRWGTET